MIIKRATKQDLPAVRALMAKYGNKMLVGPELFNKRDIALQARLPSGELIGFVWAGVMASGQYFYIDKATVDPAYSRKGVCNELYTELLRIATERGIRYSFGFIRKDQWFSASAKNALKMALQCDNADYLHVFGETNFIQSQLKALKESKHGRK